MVALLLIVIVGYNYYPGFAVKQIKISDNFEAEFAEKPQSVANLEQLQQVAADELEQRQTALENKLAELDVKRRQQKPSVTGEQALVAEAAGMHAHSWTWHSAQGESCILQQNVAALTL